MSAGARPGLSWSGTIDLGPGPLHRPTGVDELRALVGRSARIRALGTRHSFSQVAASDADLVTLDALPERIEIDTARRTVRVGAGVRYGTLVLALWEQGLALPSMGSLPHISVGGASATGTHGSGDAQRSLASSVRAIELVTADGDLVGFSREADPEVFDGMVLALGALGVVTRLELDLVPAFRMRQAVYLDLPPERMSDEGLGAVLASAYSVSMFHHWDGKTAQVWVKQEAEGDAEPMPDAWHGARRAPGPVHPAPGMSPTFCTDQSGRPGPAFEVLPHFRMEFTPSSGAEIQSEYFVPREQVGRAVAAVSERAERIRPLLIVSEIRSTAADDLWLSPAHERASACIHFTWQSRPDEVRALLPEVEAALAPFSPRPHWGKVFTMAPEAVRAQYPRLADFQALRDRLDPRRVFRNEYVDALLGE
ncbi:D-arabinono-1,4-lactone oxidase [Brachybacterium subflavum]|uniref:D-arabinono-1,4-lactone oxidase n=1 Tax=Brachybacterium subflavum TaxID=2585206 RepID=UPI0012664A80|nr:D-arabinono-1,4-lactone oxidase [Brachybacterium subflavum]